MILRVEHEEKYESMQKFIDEIHSKPVIFDDEEMTVEFDSIFLSYDFNEVKVADI